MTYSDRRNVVLVTIDSLRADHCGFMGGPDNTTPTLDALAADGVVFENAIAPGPRTPSSMPAAFTGTSIADPPAEMAAWQDRRRRIRRHLDRHETIAERFADRGYATAGVTTNPWTTRDTGFDAGFDTFVQSPNTRETWPTSVQFLHTAIKLTGTEDRFSWHNKQDWLTQWPHFYDEIDTLTDRLTEPYFLWVFLLDAHQPYLAPREYRVESSLPSMYYAAFQYWDHLYREQSQTLPPRVDKRVQRAYRDTVRSVDGFVNRLSEDLADDDPAFVIHADHGEAFGEHGSYGHQQVLFEENVHVPLLVANTDKQRRISRPVSLASLPKLVDGVARRERPVVDEATVTAETEDQTRLAVRATDWKYLDDRDEEYLFAVGTDANEREDHSVDCTEVTEALRAVAGGYRADRLERRWIGKAATAVGDNV